MTGAGEVSVRATIGNVLRNMDPAVTDDDRAVAIIEALFTRAPERAAVQRLLVVFSKADPTTGDAE